MITIQPLCEVCGESADFLKCEFNGRTIHSYTIDPLTKDKIGVVVCGRCGVGIQNPMLSDDYQGKIYGKRVNSEYGFEVNGVRIDTPIQVPWIGISLARAKTCYNTLEKSQIKLDTENIVCDYGAYSGIFLHALQSIYNCRVIGIDLNEEGASFAKAVYGIEILAEDFYTYTPRRKFTMVTLVHVFEHLKYPSKFLNHISDKVLDENGLLYIEVPNFFGYILSSAHYYHYSQNSLSSFLRRAGFSILGIFTTGYPELPHFKVGESHPSWLVCLARFTDTPIESYPDTRQIVMEYYQSMRRLDQLTTR